MIHIYEIILSLNILKHFLILADFVTYANVSDPTEIKLKIYN